MTDTIEFINARWLKPKLLTRARRVYILPHLKKTGILADQDPLVTEML